MKRPKNWPAAWAGKTWTRYKHTFSEEQLYAAYRALTDRLTHSVTYADRRAGFATALGVRAAAGFSAPLCGTATQLLKKAGLIEFDRGFWVKKGTK